MIALLIAIAATGSYAINRYRSTEAALDRSLREVFELSRPTRGRLFGTPYASYASQPTPSTALNRSQLLLLTLPPDSPSFQRFDAHIDIATHRWRDAAGVLETLVKRSPNDPALTNDLGVVYLELGNEDASFLLQAFTQFEAALRIDSRLAETAFNLALTYRLLHLTTNEQAAIQLLQELEPESAWLSELVQAEGTQPTSAPRAQSPEASWKTVLDAAFNPRPEVSDFSVPEEIAERFGNQYRGLTPAAMLAPIKGEQRKQVVELREQVQRAIGAYQTQQFDESIRLLDQLRPVAESIGSEFDELWIDLNRAGALIWTANWRAAGPLFAAVAESASRNDFKWLLAETLTVYASYPGLANRPEQIINQLREAIQLYEDIGNRSDSVRARIFLAIRMYLEGNDAESLTWANQALSLTDPDDHLQRFQSYLVVTLNPLLRGNPLDFNYNLETARRASLANRPDGVAQANMKLAELSEQNFRQEEADLYISLAEDAALEVVPISV